MNRVPSRVNTSKLTLEHIDGVPFRSLADHYNISLGSAFNYVQRGLSQLPHCADITRQYCDRWCGILLVDGKFVKVGDYDHKIPTLYGIDYLTHDIPTYTLSVAENYPTCVSFFRSLRLLNYSLKSVVCDDNQNIYQACRQIYPQAVVLLCHNHYLENVRRLLSVRTDPTYFPFVESLQTILVVKRSLVDFNRRAAGIFRYYAQDEACASVMVDIEKRKDLLLGYLKCQGTPTTTNLIESFNSHLQGRLETIKGFQDFHHADTWLNGYFLRRRTKPFSDCEGKFRHLNGKTSLSKTQKPEIDLPVFFPTRRARF